MKIRDSTGRGGENRKGGVAQSRTETNREGLKNGDEQLEETDDSTVTQLDREKERSRTNRSAQGKCVGVTAPGTI